MCRWISCYSKSSNRIPWALALGSVQLDNGVTLEVLPNEGCGGCGNGWYDVDEINGCDNAITNVEVVSNGDETCFNIFVYAEEKRIKILEVTGDDNGYYGTGYRLQVRIPRELDLEKNEEMELE